jgi:hypothetical protein
MKKATSGTLRKKALKLAQKLARISAADDNGYAHCWSCGDAYHYKEMDGGHFIAKGHSSYWALDTTNIHPQCKSCNGFGMRYGIAEQQYTINMIDYYGRDYVEMMHIFKNKSKKIGKAEYLDMIEELNNLIKYHEERVGQ